ncbi:MAG: 30S ribosomal protein S4 [Candidatus Electrothrix sp. AW2]|mgnify:CR=1 FL=1|nr:30S ribosomal protein S4 [Candidatus Electrothrix sp. AX1]MCI5117929.1 30S ribosomal protein S4 [Candidatus Electrothrix gigas]MCI5129205.1 30S ribosomal protein S4 [Candidatus Electrothrix gigas]MCI5133782.1 30S ribosomal protein S4 [Candidatus Electrothrix gigas]MCI5177731.1 30S ribosomal protein S4 [Candidatus Electrothrix gigas]
MARYTGASCRTCRRENLKLFLKGERCYSDKCSFERRAYAPGQHGQNRFRKVSDYALQLREKQKVKHMYGMLEKQFRRYFHLADQAKGVTGLNLLSMLERRLDNVVYRLGFAGSRDQARQFVRHNHFLINGNKVNIPSYQVKPGDVIGLKEKSRKNAFVVENLEGVARRGVPSWLELNKGNFQGTVKAMPNRDEITMPINEQLIVELYSK